MHGGRSRFEGLIWFPHPIASIRNRHRRDGGSACDETEPANSQALGAWKPLRPSVLRLQ
jgi:hypothetical protein